MLLPFHYSNLHAQTAIYDTTQSHKYTYVYSCMYEVMDTLLYLEFALFHVDDTNFIHILIQCSPTERLLKKYSHISQMPAASL